MTNPRFETLEFPVGGRPQGRQPEVSGDRQGQREFIEKAIRTIREIGYQWIDRPLCHSVVEVGSFAGGNALDIAEITGVDCVYCVDHWKGSAHDATSVIARTIGQRGMFKVFCKNVGQYMFRRIFPCVGDSESWASVWPHKTGIIYLDADHQYDSVKRDIELWWPHVIEGGVLMGHDYGLFPGVTQAVDEFGCDGVFGKVWYKWKNTTPPEKK